MVADDFSKVVFVSCRGLCFKAESEQHVSWEETRGTIQEICWNGDLDLIILAHYQPIFICNSPVCFQAAAHRRDDQRLNALQRTLSVLLGERQQLQAEHRCSATARSKLETLCKELQAHQCMLRVRQEGQKQRLKGQMIFNWEDTDGKRKASVSSQQVIDRKHSLCPDGKILNIKKK